MHKVVRTTCRGHASFLCAEPGCAVGGFEGRAARQHMSAQRNGERNARTGTHVEAGHCGVVTPGLARHARQRGAGRGVRRYRWRLRSCNGRLVQSSHLDHEHHGRRARHHLGLYRVADGLAKALQRFSAGGGARLRSRRQGAQGIRVRWSFHRTHRQTYILSIARAEPARHSCS